MARLELTSSIGLKEQESSFTGTSTLNYHTAETLDIDNYNSHAYQFYIDNTSSITAKVFVEVNNSDDPTLFVPVFTGEVNAGSKEIFYFKEVFNFKFSRVRFYGKEGFYRIYESHTPNFRLSSSSSGSPAGPLPPPPTLTHTLSDTSTTTETLTQSASTTATVTPTTTETFTQSASTTETFTQSATATETLTQSASSTETFTQSASTTETLTHTISDTITESYSRTTTNTHTLSDTDTHTTSNTQTASATETNTHALTDTSTLTNTDSDTITDTSSDTITTTDAETPTTTSTHSATGTLVNLIPYVAPTPCVIPTPTVTHTQTSSYYFGHIYKECSIDSVIDPTKVSINSVNCNYESTSDSYYYSVTITNNHDFTLYADYALNGVLEKYTSDTNKLIGPLAPNSTTTISIPAHQADKFEFKFFSKSVNGTVFESSLVNVAYNCESCKTANNNFVGYNHIYGLYHDNFIAISGAEVKVYNQSNKLLSTTYTTGQSDYNFIAQVPFDYYESYTVEITHSAYEEITHTQCHFDTNCSSQLITLPTLQIIPTPTGTVRCVTINHIQRDFSDYVTEDPVSVTANDLIEHCSGTAYVVSSTYGGKTHNKLLTIADSSTLSFIYETKFGYKVCFTCLTDTSYLSNTSVFTEDIPYTPSCLSDTVNVSCATPTPVPVYDLITVPSEGGEICCQGSYDLNTSVNITATPKDGYSFVGWIGTDITDANKASTQIKMTETKYVKAIFAKQKFFLSVIFDEGGSASGTGYYANCGFAEIEASPDSGYEFDTWHIIENLYEINKADMNQSFNSESTIINSMSEIPDVEFSSSEHLDDDTKIVNKSTAKTEIQVCQNLTVVAKFKKIENPIDNETCDFICEASAFDQSKCPTISIDNGPNYTALCSGENYGSPFDINTNGEYSFLEYDSISGKSKYYKKVEGKNLYIIITGSIYTVNYDSQDFCALSGKVTISHSESDPLAAKNSSSNNECPPEIIKDPQECFISLNDELCQHITFNDTMKQACSSVDLSFDDPFKNFDESGIYTLASYDKNTNIAEYIRSANGYYISVKGTPVRFEVCCGDFICTLSGDLCFSRIDYDPYSSTPKPLYPPLTPSVTSTTSETTSETFTHSASSTQTTSETTSETSSSTQTTSETFTHSETYTPLTPTLSQTTTETYTNLFSNQFDGDGDHIELDSEIVFSGDFTFSGWFKPESSSELRISESEAGTSEMFISLNSEALGSSIIARNIGSLTSPQDIVKVGSWFHFMIARGGSGSNNLKMFINGAQVTQTTNTTVSAKFKTFGKHSDSQGWNGKIDELALWNSDQSSNISSIYNNGVPTYHTVDPLHWYRLGEHNNATGTAITDQGSGGVNANYIPKPDSSDTSIYSTEIPFATTQTETHTMSETLTHTMSETLTHTMSETLTHSATSTSTHTASDTETPAATSAIGLKSSGVRLTKQTHSWSITYPVSMSGTLVYWSGTDSDGVSWGIYHPDRDAGADGIGTDASAYVKPDGGSITDALSGSNPSGTSDYNNFYKYLTPSTANVGGSNNYYAPAVLVNHDTNQWAPLWFFANTSMAQSAQDIIPYTTWANPSGYVVCPGNPHSSYDLRTSRAQSYLVENWEFGEVLSSCYTPSGAMSFEIKPF